MNKFFKDSQIPQLALLTSGLIYAIYGPLTRITGNDFGEITQSFIRAVMRVLIILCVIIFIKDFKRIQKKDIPWFLLSGIAGAGSTLLYTYAIQKISMGTTMFLFYGTGIIVSFIIGKLIYKEHLNTSKIVSLIFSILGLLILFIREIDFSNLFYLILASLSGVCYSIYSTFSKKVSNNYSITQIVLSFAIIDIFVYAGSFLFISESSNFASITPWISNFVFALLVSINVFLMVYGFKHLEAQKASLLLLSELLFIILIGVIFYSEIPSIQEFFGSILIFIGLTLPYIKNGK